MKRIALSAALLAALLAAPAGALADDFTDKAKAALDKVEQEMPDQKPGDKLGGKRLGDEVNAARDILKQSKEKDKDDWKAEDARSKDLIAKINARYKEKPGSGGAAAGGAALGVMDKRNLDDFHANCQGWTKEIQAAQPIDFGADGGKWKGCSSRLRALLAKIKDQQNADVQAAIGQADEFDKLLAGRMEEGKKALAEQGAKDASEKQDVDKQIADLDTFFDEKTFTCELKAPFDEARVRAWVANLKQWDAMKAKGVAMLDKIAADHPKYAKDPRVGRLRGWFQTMLPRKLDMGINKTARSVTSEGSTSKGAMPARVEIASRLLAPDMLTEKRLADDKWVANSTRTAQDGLEAARALLIFHKEYEGKDDADIQKSIADLTGLLAKLDAGAKDAIAGTRMPEAKATDADLLAAAAETLKNPDYGCKGAERTVINWEKHHFSEEHADGRIDGDYIVVTRWTEEWDEFQVTTAEKDGDACRLVCYDLRNYSRGDRTTPIGRWIVSQRMPGRRILQENIAR